VVDARTISGSVLHLSLTFIKEGVVGYVVPLVDRSDERRLTHGDRYEIRGLELAPTATQTVVRYTAAHTRLTLRHRRDPSVPPLPV
jgi:hypothetical protein